MDMRAKVCLIIGGVLLVIATGGFVLGVSQIDDIEDVKNLDLCEPIVKLIVEWCLDDKGINLLYKNNGVDRYPDFKLYKMIARTVHKHTPQEQLKFDYFNQYLSVTDTAIDNIMNIDTLPTYY